MPAPTAIPETKDDATGAELPAVVARPAGRVDEYLSAYLDELKGLGRIGPLPANLLDAVRYSLLGPGKRARPLLVWHSHAAVLGARGGEVMMKPSRPAMEAEDCLWAAGAIELVHAFSLVHDDLPGLDNDDLRRGRPTLHKYTSESMAILAGDVMMGLAFQLLADKAPSASLGYSVTLELVQATNAMIGGQVYDTLGGFPGGLSDEQRLAMVHRNKTGALIRAACRMGGLCAGPWKDSLERLTRYGDAIGLMFQIVDDLLDVTQTTEHLGKKAGKDQNAGKLTYPGVLGIERSRAEVRRLHGEAVDALDLFGEHGAPLRLLAGYLANRTR